MENNLYGISYSEWKCYVSLLMSAPSNNLDKYIQTYPFSRLSSDEKEILVSQEFYEQNISSGSFLSERNLIRTETVMTKNDGSLRNVTIVTPIVYLVLLCIGGHIFENMKSIKSEYSQKFYSGSFSQGWFNYSESYKEFTMTVLSQENEYKYYFKTDISNFYSSINLDVLFKRIEKMTDINSPRELLFFKTLFEYIGQGRFPTVTDNTGLSYIATTCYLSEFDKELNLKLLNDEIITSFNLVRYVDDLYIFFNCDKDKKNIAEDDIKTFLQNVASNSFLTINFSKQKIAETKNISEDLYNNLYDYFVEREDIDYNDYFGRENIIALLDKLAKLTYPNHSDVEQIMNQTLHNEKFPFHYTEILNWFLYSQTNYFGEPIIKDKVRSLVGKMDVIRHYPKQFTQMILCTKDRSIIVEFLNNLFTSYKHPPFSKYYEVMAVQYLLARSFKHVDLKSEISTKNSKLGGFIASYCDQQRSHLSAADGSYISILNKMKNDGTLNFLGFMSFYYMDKNQILECFAYEKNYFDRKLSYFLALLNGQKSKNDKVSFKSTYKKNCIDNIVKKTGFDFDDKMIEDVKKAYDLRNKNPVSHASAELLDRNDLESETLKKYISSMNKFLDIVGNLAVGSAGVEI